MWRFSMPDGIRRSPSFAVLAVCVVATGLLFGTSVAADSSTTNSGSTAERWYDRERVQRGALIYAQHCTSCHGENGEGTKNWRQRGADGKFPPPPIDGTAHAWHHPIEILGRQIKFGAPGGQGNMPGFADKLSDEAIIDVIAWMQDRWPDEIYAHWIEIERRSRSR